MSALCADCGTALQGRYCSACGQKRFEENDRRLPVLLGEFLREFFEWDNRWWRSLFALLFRPGILGRAWLEGRRTRYMKSVTLFLIANFLYFFAPALSDFDLSLHEQMHQAHSAVTTVWIEHRVAARAKHDPHYTLDTYAKVYDEKSERISKFLIVLHVPFLALALLILFWRRRIYYAEHFAIALQLFAFMLIALQALPWPLNPILIALGPAWQNLAGNTIRFVLAASILTYFTLTLRRVYASGWIYSALGAAALVAVVLYTNLYIYRVAQFALTFALT